MPGSAAKLVITERQQAVLRQIVAAPTSPVRLVQRACSARRPRGGSS
jgi:hypothetical protein